MLRWFRLKNLNKMCDDSYLEIEHEFATFKEGCRL